VRHAWFVRALLKHLAIGGAAVVVTAIPFAAYADSDVDNDRARELHEHGEIQALDDILRVIGAQALGDVISIDLVRVADKWVYRFQIVAGDGHRTRLEVDAGAGTVLSDLGGGGS